MRGASGVSALPMPRPSTMGMPIVRKKPSLTGLSGMLGTCARGGSGCPSITNTDDQCAPSVGSVRVKPTERTPGTAVTVETIGTDAGQAGRFDPPFPNHTIMHGAGKFGLASLANLDQLPATGAVVIAAPLKIVNGSGSPVRVLALVPGA